MSYGDLYLITVVGYDVYLTILLYNTPCCSRLEKQLIPGSGS